jgi:hypothetical protein
MVSNSALKIVAFAVRLYVVVTAATVLALAVMAVAAPHLATNHALGRAIVVAVFAVVLPLRLRAAIAGRRSGLRAVGLISATLFVVIVVEALIPGYFPTWMRVQMLGVVALMAVIVLLVTRAAIATSRGDRSTVAVPD